MRGFACAASRRLPSFVGRNCEPMSSFAKLVLVAVAVAISLAIVGWVMSPWLRPVEIQSSCRLPDFTFVRAASDTSGEFNACLERNAKLFLAKDYAETKDLASTFLTLLSAILVASITFCEKIVDVHNARRTPLVAMIACWLLLMLAIVFTGSGLASMAVGAGYAAYHPSADYWSYEVHAVCMFVSGGLAFGFAMLALILASVISLSDKHAAAVAQRPAAGSQLSGASDEGASPSPKSERNKT